MIARTEEEIREKMEAFQRKLPNFPKEASNYIFSEAVVKTLKWVLNEI